MRILVVGGGIGGLSAGVALRNAGVEVDLVELKEDWSVYGVGIIQPGNALRALDRIGLASACVAAGAPFEGWRLHDARGNVLASLPASTASAPGFPPLNGITRPALHQILVGAAQNAGVVIKMGTTITSWIEHDDYVAVELSDGMSERYDLVVAADGIRSYLREKIFGSTHRPDFLGEGIWRYNLPRSEGMDWGGIFFGPRSKAGLVPLSKTTMYMFLVTPEPDDRRYEGSDLAEQMRARLIGHDGLIGELRAVITDPGDVVYRPAHTIMVPAPWYRGRFLLIGDAAHSAPPHLAQGAAMAIEDAVVLAELLSGDCPVPTALENFMSRRFDRSKLVVDVSKQTAFWETEEWAGRPDPAANPGKLLSEASSAMLEEI